jgi:DNA-binding winged helix-turn-helix (wHTH) protein
MSNDLYSSSTIVRHADLAYIFDALSEMECVSVVGFSNLGKSALLRSLAQSSVQAALWREAPHEFLFVYIDFNQMLEMTEQGFYELLLRCAADTLREQVRADEVLSAINSAYRRLVAPASSFEIPLSFSQGMAAIGDLLPQRVVFLLDELDGPLSEIDGRVFLNLRAMRDRHRAGLTYVTATNRRLSEIRRDPDVAEFAELVAHHTHFLSLLDRSEADAYMETFAAHEGVTFSLQDRDFIYESAGGHPGLLEAVCRLLGQNTGAVVRDAAQDNIIHRRTAEEFGRDLNLQAECRGIWNDLTSGEQEVLFNAPHEDWKAQLPELASVRSKHLLLGTPPECRFFARTFEVYVKRQRVTARPHAQGLEVDASSGEVWVNGQKIPTLTNLEFRLLLLLYGRPDKICSKYDVVDSVWGEEYIDQVDDARIEKLVSRLRQKIEPDINDPRFVLTMRGRGYKLAK